MLNELSTNVTAEHPGAIVAGLGIVGELTPGALTATLTHSLTLYGAQAVGIERRRRMQGISQSDASELPLRVMPLLVGGGDGGVTVADSIQAILRAVQAANSRFATTSDDAADLDGKKDDKARISARIIAVEILLLFEDRAIYAARELLRFSRASDFRNEFVFDELLVPGEGGQQRLTFNDMPGWWQRVRIEKKENGELKFEALTNRARAEASLLPTQQLMAHNLLE